MCQVEPGLWSADRRVRTLARLPRRLIEAIHRAGNFLTGLMITESSRGSHGPTLNFAPLRSFDASTAADPVGSLRSRATTVRAGRGLVAATAPASWVPRRRDRP